MIRKLEKMPYAQAKIIATPQGKEFLQSYETIVAEYDINTGWLVCFGLYSMTTRRQISAYCQEIGTEYSMAKYSYEHHCKVNIYTGEVEKISSDGEI